MNSNSPVCVVAAVAAAVLAGCADLSRGGPPADAAADTSKEGGGDASSASFASVQPLLLAGCQPCHSSNGEASDTQLIFTGESAADYAITLRFIEVATPVSGRLVSKMAGVGHGGGTVYAADTPEYITIVRWIEGGALP